VVIGKISWKPFPFVFIIIIIVWFNYLTSVGGSIAI
jgi:hypothetical protein